MATITVDGDCGSSIRKTFQTTSPTSSAKAIPRRDWNYAQIARIQPDGTYRGATWRIYLTATIHIDRRRRRRAAPRDCRGAHSILRVLVNGREAAIVRDLPKDTR
nr:hypothetical protein [Ereboglobus luteus]